MLVSVGYVCDGDYITVQDNINSPICLITWWPCCPKFAEVILADVSQEMKPVC